MENELNAILQDLYLNKEKITETERNSLERHQKEFDHFLLGSLEKTSKMGIIRHANDSSLPFIYVKK
jgi:hypothetical protein